MTIEHLKSYKATFLPKRRDDLVPGMEKFIGCEGVFMAAWIIEDSATYAGDWAMTTPEGWPCSWVPLCDLKDVKEHER